MAEVPFRPVRQLSEYKGKGASASREVVSKFTNTSLLSQHLLKATINVAVSR